MRKTGRAPCLFCIYKELSTQNQIKMNKEKEFTVVVTADAAKNVVVPSKNNPDWGHIRVEQDRIVIDDRGFGRKKRVSALIPGLIGDLKSFGWKADEKIEGSIIFKEQLTPFNPKDPERDYKIAGKTGVVCCIDGQPIYRKTFYSKDPNAKDVHILDEQGNPMTHNNGDAIRAAYAELAEKEKAGAKNGLGQM